MFVGFRYDEIICLDLDAVVVFLGGWGVGGKFCELSLSEVMHLHELLIPHIQQQLR